MPKEYHISTDFDCVGTDQIDKDIDTDIDKSLSEIYEDIDTKAAVKELKIKLLEDQISALTRSYELCLLQCNTYKEIIKALGGSK